MNGTRKGKLQNEAMRSARRIQVRFDLRDIRSIRDQKDFYQTKPTGGGWAKIDNRAGEHPLRKIAKRSQCAWRRFKVFRNYETKPSGADIGAQSTELASIWWTG